MKKVILSFIFSSTLFVSYAQKMTCNTPEADPFEDLNTIAKCTVIKKKSKDKKTRELSVKISVSKKRFLKKRSVAKKGKVEKLGSLNTNGVNSNGSNGLFLKTNIASLSRNLSTDQVRKANKFSDVNVIPAFKACKSKKGAERSECFRDQMIVHIENYFKYPDEAVIKKIEGQVWVRFIIDENGNVSNIKALGPKNTDLLEEEAVRVASHLPRLIPAVKNGKNVPVKYGFPVNFSLNE